VTENYNLTSGCGKAGGGFLFDTHTIHRGTTEGSQERLTVIVEFHNPRKCAVLDAAGFGLPCPSGDQFLIDRPVPTVDAVGTERA